MTTKTVNLFTFDELSDSAKEKARDWYRTASCDDSFSSEYILDEAKEQAQKMGLDIDKIYYSGFSNQGDGCCYIGDWHASRVTSEVADGWGESPATSEIKRIAGEFKAFADKYPESSFRVKHSGHYYHKYCTDFTVSLGEENDDSENLSQEEWSAAENSLIETARDYMEWIYRQLEKEYEYQNSDECVDESILANQYTFLEDGERED